MRLKRGQLTRKELNSIAANATRFFNGCTGKRKYSSKRLASSIAKLTGEGVQAYRCQFCKGWHVGHSK